MSPPPFLESDKDTQQAFGWASKSSETLPTPVAMTLVAGEFCRGHGRLAVKISKRSTWLQKAADNEMPLRCA